MRLPWHELIVFAQLLLNGMALRMAPFKNLLKSLISTASAQPKIKKVSQTADLFDYFDICWSSIKIDGKAAIAGLKPYRHFSQSCPLKP